MKLWDLRCFSQPKAVAEAARAVKNHHWDYRYERLPKVGQPRMNAFTSTELRIRLWILIRHKMTKVKKSKNQNFLGNNAVSNVKKTRFWTILLLEKLC
jgi:hypothetical protein